MSQKLAAKRVSNKLSLYVFLCFALTGFSGTVFSGDFLNNTSGDKDSKTIITPGEKKPFSFARGDAVLTLGGKSVTEHRFAKNAVLLNNNIPDEAGHFRQTLDTTMGLVYGEKKFGHKALELSSTVRFKTIWGKVGYMAKTERDGAHKIAEALVGEHSHPSARSLVWIKDAWLKFSLNSVFGHDDTEKLHFIKAGMFSFYLGRGISLGPIYGFTKSYLAVFSRETDYSAPGILFSGEAVKDILSYDLYYSKLEEKSASFSDVFNSNKEKILGRRKNPWSGPAKDSDLIAARLKVTPFGKEKKYGDLNLEPYILYNEASDQQVLLPADSKSMLGTVGFAAEYKKKSFEIGGEIAANYGHEKIHAIDTNQVVIRMVELEAGKTALQSVFNKILYVSNPDKNLEVTSVTKAIVAGNSNLYNSALFSNDTNYISTDDRFRTPYTNKYRGWMGVVDASYLFENFDLKFAAAYGYASGDKHPHAEKKDKSYKGFVGLYELYSGSRVPSVFVLDARKIKRPLTLQEGSTSEVDSEATFSDIQYFGIGATWKPKWLKERNCSINPNILFFRKVHRSPKYDRELEAVSATAKARKGIGTEFNVISSIDLIKDLTLSANLSMFVPSNYYDDIKGAPMRGDLFNQLEETDRASLVSSTYRISTDTAFYTQIVLTYKF